MSKLLNMFAFLLFPWGVGSGFCIAFTDTGVKEAWRSHSSAYSCSLILLFIGLAVIGYKVYYKDREDSWDFFWKCIGVSVISIGSHLDLIFYQSFSVPWKMGWVCIGCACLLTSFLEIDFERIRARAYLRNLDPTLQQRLEAFEQKYIDEYLSKRGICE